MSNRLINSYYLGGTSSCSMAAVGALKQVVSSLDPTLSEEESGDN